MGWHDFYRVEAIRDVSYSRPKWRGASTTKARLEPPTTVADGEDPSGTGVAAREEGGSASSPQRLLAGLVSSCKE